MVHSANHAGSHPSPYTLSRKAGEGGSFRVQCDANLMSSSTLNLEP